MNKFSIEFSKESAEQLAGFEATTFGRLSIFANELCLTEGHDHYTRSLKNGPLVAGYYLAEWLVWNWWRIRWENQGSGLDWMSAHSMSSVGEGFIWPNIKIVSDGYRIALISNPSHDTDAKPFRYLGTLPTYVMAKDYEQGVDEFVRQVLSLLDECDLVDSNLHTIWNDLNFERNDERLSTFRRIEAMLGFEPDEMSEQTINRFIRETERLGMDAVEELAAQRSISHKNSKKLSADYLDKIARNIGFDTKPQSSFKAQKEKFKIDPIVEPWKLAKRAAKFVRRSQKFGNRPITNQELADLLAVSKNIFNASKDRPPIPFSIDAADDNSKIVVRTAYESNTRFDLARILGDRLIQSSSTFHPATQTHTYRQQAQRSFAAELLSPIEAVEDFMKGDFSDERQDEAAHHFNVSPMMINTLLVNHHRIGRESLMNQMQLALGQRGIDISS